VIPSSQWGNALDLVGDGVREPAGEKIKNTVLSTNKHQNWQEIGHHSKRL